MTQPVTGGEPATPATADPTSTPICHLLISKAELEGWPMHHDNGYCHTGHWQLRIRLELAFFRAEDVTEVDAYVEVPEAPVSGAEVNQAGEVSMARLNTWSVASRSGHNCSAKIGEPPLWTGSWGFLVTSTVLRWDGTWDEHWKGQMEAGDAPGTFFIGDMKDSTYFVIRRRYDGQVLVAKKATLTQFVGH